MSVWVPVLVVLGSVTISIAGLFALSRRVQNREPYGSFLHLRTRQKIRFFKLLLTDKRVPLLVKSLPLALIPYLAMPFDVIPDFIPVLGYMDDVAIVVGVLVLVVRLTPRPVLDDLFRLAAYPEQS